VACEQPPPLWWAPENAAQVEPVTLERPELSLEVRALENLLISHFDGHDLAMPPMPRLAEQVLQSLRDPNCDLKRVAHVIAEDPVIAAEVMRTANSVLYRGLNKIVTLPSGVIRLGTNTIRTLMMRHSLRAATFSHKGRDPELANIVWYRALAGGYLMRALARFACCDEEEAFLVGLLHDIGNVIVLRLASEQQAVTKTQIDLQTFDYLCFECHQEFGELIAEAWNLPPKLKALISNHHTYPAPDDPVKTERLLLILADMISSMFSYGPPAHFRLLETRTAADLQLVGRQDFVEFLRTLPDELEETLDSFGEPPSERKRTDDKPTGGKSFRERLSAMRRGRTHDPHKLGRRQFPRWSASGKDELIVWTDEKRYAALALVAGMSENGMSIWFPEPLEVGRTLYLADQSGDLLVEARVIRISDQPNEQKRYRIGLALVTIDSVKSGEANAPTRDSSSIPRPVPVG